MASCLSVFKYLEIQLEDIKSATNNFHDSRVIGRGGFGNVYKGELSHPEAKIEVAFKRLDRKYGQGDPEFYKEIMMLSSYKHKNLISLLGYCNEGTEMILMYEYASSGSLDKILHSPTLTWMQRLKICLGAAEGLTFLHDPQGTQQRVLHRDIKSANILLDEDLNAKVADFGLSKISPANQQHTFLFTSPAGTHGYCDPLYMVSYQLTKESDVYSFGVVLFEVLCGKVCYKNSNGKFETFVPHWKKCYEQKKLDEVIFQDLKQQMDSSSFETFVDIAYQCLQVTHEQRPTMSDVVKKLKDAVEFKEGYDLKLQREREAELMRKAAEYEAEQRRKAAEYEAEQRRKAAEYEAEQRRKAAEQEQIRKAAEYEAELIRKAAEYEAEQICKAAEYQAEQMRKAAEEEQMRKAAEQERVRKAEEQERMRKAEELERTRKAEEQERMRKAAEQERMRKDAEQEPMRKAAEQEYKEILKSADPPLRFLEFPVNGGKTLLSVNHNGEVICERIYIEACLDQTRYDCLEDAEFENSRFPGGRCYYKNEKKLKVHVTAQFLCPRITYSVNLVFRNAEGMRYCKTLHYKLDGEAKCCMVYNMYEREDGWFVVPLYMFTSNYRSADFEINFRRFQDRCNLQIAGFEFQPLEEKVELHDEGLEELQDIVKAASQSLFYKSTEELKELLTIGFHINNHKTWFSLNKNGEHCEMLSIAHCLISREGGYSFCNSDFFSRFPNFIKTKRKGFKVQIRTQFLTPSIIYTVNLVLRKEYYDYKPKYVALKYKLKGKTETSIVYLAAESQDGYSYIAELYQFTSDGRIFDLEIVFEDHESDLKVEGILLQPLEKVEHEQVLEDEGLSNDSLQWTMCSNYFKWFIGYGQEGYAVDNRGMKSLMFSARGAIPNDQVSYRIPQNSLPPLSFKSSPESRFGEVAVITHHCFDIVKKIKSDVLSPETTYACYLIYRLPKRRRPTFNGFLKLGGFKDFLDITPLDYPYIYIGNPPKTPLNGPKLYAVPRQRKDGWMEVKVGQFQTPCSTQTIHMKLWLRSPDSVDMHGLMIESIEIRPTSLGAGEL